MQSIKPSNFKKTEIFVFIFIIATLIFNAIYFKDPFLAVIQAFFGITYTSLAGKGNPKCYLFGLSGSLIYSWLSFAGNLWGNLILYLCYYVPMQIIGFFKWNKNLKQNSNDIVKISLNKKEFLILILITIFITLLTIYLLYKTGDSMPVIDGITTVFSVTGMYLTVKRCIEQWIIWMLVNGLSAIMWAVLAFEGNGAYSTVFMWLIYFLLSFYFYFEWKKEILTQK